MKFECNCIYCNRNTYLWKLKNDIVWVEIPRNGSSNLKEFRFKFNSLHTIESQNQSELIKVDNIDKLTHKRAFVILRNPIDRFKSLVSHYFIYGQRVHFGKQWLNNLGIYEFNNDTIVDIVLQNWDKIHTIPEVHHLNSQRSFIPDEFFEINHMVYDVGEIGFMFGLNQKVNPSDSSNIQISNENLEKIIDIYKDDVELYKKYFNVSL